MEEEGAFIDNSVPMDEAIAAHAARTGPPAPLASPVVRMDPPEDQPPSLSKRGGGAGGGGYSGSQSLSSADDPSQRSAFEGDSLNQDGSALMSTASSYHGGGGSFSPRGRRGAQPEYNDGDEDLYYNSPGDHAAPSEGFSPHQQQQYPSEQYSAGPDPDDEYQRHPQEHEDYDLQPDDEYDRKERYQKQQQKQQQQQQQPDDEFEPSDEFYSDENMARQPSEGPYYSNNDAFSPGSKAEFSLPAVSQSGTISRTQFTTGSLELSPDNTREMESPGGSPGRSDHWQLPPTSPRNGAGESYSPSSATRGAQELLRRNRQRRLELSRQARKSPGRAAAGGHLSPGTASASSVETFNLLGGMEEDPTVDVMSPRETPTWESGSNAGSSVTAGSSVWTDNDTVPDRSSRRALILQMAKARMKSTKQQPEEQEETLPIAVNDEKKDNQDTLSSDGIDFVGDLD